MKTAIFIQARSNSTRLPGKIYEKVGDKTVLEHVIDRCKKADSEIIFVLGPTDDKKLRETCQEMKIGFILGGQEDKVLDRYKFAIEEFAHKIDAFIRITSDCIFVSTELIKACIKELETADYVSACLFRSFPEGIGDIQGCKREAFEWIAKYAEDQEHVFGIFEDNAVVRNEFMANGFKIQPIVNSKNEIFIKTSIDTKEDLERARKWIST